MRAQTDSALEAYERAAVHARHAGLPHRFLDGACQLSVLRHDSRTGNPGVAGRARATRRRDSGSVCTGPGAGDARSLRRGASDPRRNACRTGRARRWRELARDHDGPGTVDVGSWPAIPPLPRSSGKRVQTARRAGENGTSCRLRPENSRRRTTRSAGSRTPTLGRPRSGARCKRRRAAHRCSGGRSRRKCSRVAASRRRPSDSRARQSRSATEQTCSTAQGDAYADLGRRARARRAPAEATAALERALERYDAQGRPRLGAARAGAIRRAPAHSVSATGFGVTERRGSRTRPSVGLPRLTGFEDEPVSARLLRLRVLRASLSPVR